MSADNWAICPRCVDRARAASKERFVLAAKAYGTVSPEEYEEIRIAAMEPVDVESFRTFREDYETYDAATGNVKVSYSGHCKECNLGLDFKDEHPFYEPETEVEDGGM